MCCCGAEWVVIKCGPHGAAIFTKDGFEAGAGSPFVPVRDTVGCGDSAAAAIVLGYLNIERARWRDMKDTVLNYVSNSTLLDMLEETLTLATTIGAATAMGDRLEEMLPQLKLCEHYYLEMTKVGSTDSG